MKQKIARLVREVAARSGLDFTKYQKPEMVQRALNLIGFPQYAGFIVFLPAFALLLLAVALAIYLKFKVGDLAALLAAGLGVYAAFSSGLSLGLRNLAKRLVHDISAIVDDAFEISILALRDRHRLREQLPSPGDMLRGVTLIAFLPALLDGLKKRFGFFAFVFRWPLQRALYHLAKNGGELLDSALSRAQGVKARDLPRTPAPASSPSAWEAESVLENSRRRIHRIAGDAASGFSLPFLALFLWNTGVNAIVCAIAYFAYQRLAQ